MGAKRAEMSTKCACGFSLKFSIEKPTRFDPTIAKVTCQCGSRYMFSCMIDKKSGDANIEAHVLEFSDKVKALVKKRLSKKKEKEAVQL